MKGLNRYIKESILDDEDDLIDSVLYHPKSKDELIEAIINCLENKIYDLNCIDTSKITDMSRLFDMATLATAANPLKKYRNHLDKIDISKWDVSNVKYMDYMFFGSNFNGNISKWDVSNVTKMYGMFEESKFNQDISKWDVSNVTDMSSMFNKSNFNRDISKWDVSNVKYMDYMFFGSNFNGNISKWNVSNVFNYHRIFDNCPIKEKYKPKFK